MSNIDLEDFISKNNSTLFYSGYAIDIQLSNGSEEADSEALKKSLAIVDSKECISKLISEGEITSDEKVYYVINNYDSSTLNSNSTSTSKSAKVTFISSSGKIINTSLCDNIEIKLSAPTNLNTTDYDSIKSQYNQDIYNSSSEFLNDKCYQYSNDGVDYTITLRRETYDLEASCGIDCTYSGIDSNNYIVCSCSQISQETYTDFKDKVWTSLTSSNFILITCFSTVFNSKILKNIGFWAQNILFIITIFVLIYYYCILSKKTDYTKIVYNDASFLSSFSSKVYNNIVNDVGKAKREDNEIPRELSKIFII